MRARGRLKAAAHIHCSGNSTLTTSPPLSARSSSGDGALAPKVENLLPRVLEWYTRVETELLPQGRLLSETEMKIARQSDRLGRAAFLRRYITEMEMLGYSRSPPEIEAYQKQRVAH